jgi:lactate dehydrogenase-like 2-hydroxyacid dehydrogenase
MNPDLRILVSGAGSIGKRHVKNLRTLGMTNLHVIIYGYAFA